jgi:hypothetical protein
MCWVSGSRWTRHPFGDAVLVSGCSCVRRHMVGMLGKWLRHMHGYLAETHTQQSPVGLYNRLGLCTCSVMLSSTLTRPHTS